MLRRSLWLGVLLCIAIFPYGFGYFSCKKAQKLFDQWVESVQAPLELHIDRHGWLSSRASITIRGAPPGAPALHVRIAHGPWVIDPSSPCFGALSLACVTAVPDLPSEVKTMLNPWIGTDAPVTLEGNIGFSDQHLSVHTPEYKRNDQGPMTFAWKGSRYDLTLRKDSTVRQTLDFGPLELHHPGGSLNITAIKMDMEQKQHPSLNTPLLQLRFSLPGLQARSSDQSSIALSQFRLHFDERVVSKKLEGHLSSSWEKLEGPQQLAIGAMHLDLQMKNMDPQAYAQWAEAFRASRTHPQALSSPALRSALSRLVFSGLELELKRFDLILSPQTSVHLEGWLKCPKAQAKTMTPERFRKELRWFLSFKLPKPYLESMVSAHFYRELRKAQALKPSQQHDDDLLHRQAQREARKQMAHWQNQGLLKNDGFHDVGSMQWPEILEKLPQTIPQTKPESTPHTESKHKENA